MKKLFLFILTLVYLTSTTGASVQLHICMDKIVEAKDVCGKCGMDKKEQKEQGCCKDISAQVKVDNGHYAISQFKILQTAILNHPLFLEYPLDIYQGCAICFPKNNAPPETGVSQHIRNCVFLI